MANAPYPERSPLWGMHILIDFNSIAFLPAMCNTSTKKHKKADDTVNVIKIIALSK
jgi:hypothetical protein